MATDNDDIVDELTASYHDSFAVVVIDRSMDSMHHRIQRFQDVDDEYVHKTMVLAVNYSFAV